jgi:polyferredoxin
MKKLIFARKFSQIFFLLLFIYILWSAIHTGLFFKIDPLIVILNSLSGRIIIPGIIFAVTMLILTFVFGRFFCGWICPLGSVIDCLGIKTKNRALGLTRIKYYIFGIIVILALSGIQITWVFDPLVITARFMSLNFIPSFIAAIDKIFIFFIKLFNFYTPLYDFYRLLKSSILGAKVYYFPHSVITLGFFLIICSLIFITKRFWCRVLCPLGAMYAILAKFSILRRFVAKCSRCMKCRVNCRMSAINEDMSYKKEECVLCMDCVYDCPEHVTKFTWPTKKPGVSSKKDGVSRKDFLFLTVSSFLLMGSKTRGGEVKKKLIRPPGATDEHEFLNKCVRCGNCMRTCPTKGLQPAMFEAGFSGIWTPHLVPEIGYCEYNCNLCGTVCPTAAIPRLSLAKKKEQKLGSAYIDKDLCIAWAENKECIVCEEHCPVPQKAIKINYETFNGKKIPKPYVDISLCVGCGICQNKCPTRPIRSITVLP